MSGSVFATDALFGDHPITLACDMQCNKAFGKDQRPTILEIDGADLDTLSLVWLADDELPAAPTVASRTSNGVNKPQDLLEAHNMWCGLICERCVIVDPGEEVILPDFSQRIKQ